MHTGEDDALVRAACEVRDRAHAPYSGYKVGAALRACDGRIFAGTNIENSAYPLCLCAERSALACAVSAGVTRFDAIAVVTQPGPDGSPGAPCGACRQALNEFAPQLIVIMAGPEGRPVQRDRLDLLLPKAFGHERLHGVADD